MSHSRPSFRASKRTSGVLFVGFLVRSCRHENYTYCIRTRIILAISIRHPFLDSLDRPSVCGIRGGVDYPKIEFKPLTPLYIETTVIYTKGMS